MNLDNGVRPRCHTRWSSNRLLLWETQYSLQGLCHRHLANTHWVVCVICNSRTERPSNAGGSYNHTLGGGRLMNLEGKQNGYARRVCKMYKNDTRESIVGGDQ
jgi:hypothetical protein